MSYNLICADYDDKDAQSAAQLLGPFNTHFRIWVLLIAEDTTVTEM
jgi:hypothetical protein